ncbi:hypothetical protein TNCV_1872771 [Trichonephila clavipes]|nr:hypothetical protein TNCV_1872771 [Trichonephila clavipes]
MYRSGGQSETKLSVLRPQASLVLILSTHCRRDERLSRLCPNREKNSDLWCGNRSSSGRLHAILNTLCPLKTITFLSFTCIHIIALKHHSMFCIPFRRI